MKIISKKGDRSRCENWRTIRILNSVSKILAQVLLNRFKDSIEITLRNNQAGFKEGYSCMDQTCSLTTIIEDCNKCQIMISAICREAISKCVQNMRLMTYIKAKTNKLTLSTIYMTTIMTKHNANSKLICKINAE